MQASGTADTLQSVFFLDRNQGWIAGQNGIILHTTNGGVFWEKVASGSTRWFTDISFSDADHGWVTGPTGMLHTKDGGLTWNKHGLTDMPLNAVWFTPDQYGWAVGEGGTILHFEDWGPVSYQTQAGTSGNVNLRVFPNPGSGNTTLEYTLPKSSKVKIRIYDLHGRLVFQPFDGWQAEGNQRITLDVSHLDPGMYICTLESQGVAALEKMIRLR
jgi:hypothetical protein